MKRLMKAAVLPACVGAMLSIAGCGDSSTPNLDAKDQAKGIQKAGVSSAENKPEEVVLNVLKTVQSGKADQLFLSKYCEKDTVEYLAGFGTLITEALKGAEFSVVYTFVDDDVAVVKIKQNGGRQPGESYYDAKNVDGQWKIQINANASDDYKCISQKSISACVEAFKEVVLKAGDAKCKEMFTKESWDAVQGGIKNASAEELAKMQDAVGKLKIIGHKKSVLHEDAIELSCEMPNSPKVDLVLQAIEGKWKISSID